MVIEHPESKVRFPACYLSICVLNDLSSVRTILGWSNKQSVWSISTTAIQTLRSVSISVGPKSVVDFGHDVNLRYDYTGKLTYPTLIY